MASEINNWQTYTSSCVQASLVGVVSVKSNMTHHTIICHCTKYPWCEVHHRKEMLSATIVIRMHIQAQLITGILSFLLPPKLNAFMRIEFGTALRNCNSTLFFFRIAVFPHACAWLTVMVRIFASSPPMVVALSCPNIEYVVDWDCRSSARIVTNFNKFSVP